ncbi:sensor histidine kinase [Nocardia aurantia]|uniref:histidine kinase n=1 Tax=Nocardia aurantia TaxID=2585199 RepID=A0A7K0E3B8_9NOCA|nr:sensor histidine kinase [Nocardia aurantia]MQY31912.1 hypothetical protein [Nocardia aurantia]
MDSYRRRELIVDTVMVIAALGAGLTSEQNILYGDPHGPVALRVADVVLGTACLAGIWIWRRRRPVAFAVAAIVIGIVSTLAGGVGLICAFTVAEYRHWRIAVAISVLAAVAIPPALALYPVPHAGRAFAVGALATFAVTGWGMFVRARRLLLDSMRRRLREAEQAATERAATARRAERERIAREMHDVLAHRLSLIAIHAGALEYHRGASAEDIAAAAAVIRGNTHDALTDLRQVIGLLREDTDEGHPFPRPTLADLPVLLRESREAGLEVACTVPQLELASTSATGRILYRIVQEGLTNVRKHAPKAKVVVRVEDSEHGIDVLVHNEASPVDRPIVPPPGSGTGLTGLRERVHLAGGRIESDPMPGGGFRLHAWLPNPAADREGS